MLGDDLGSVIEESSQAFQQWGLDAEDMGAAMDYVFKASQSTGTGFTELISALLYYVFHQRKLVFSHAIISMILLLISCLTFY